jgi:hypothetical protein
MSGGDSFPPASWSADQPGGSGNEAVSGARGDRPGDAAADGADKGWQGGDAPENERAANRPDALRIIGEASFEDRDERLTIYQTQLADELDYWGLTLPADAMSAEQLPPAGVHFLDVPDYRLAGLWMVQHDPAALLLDLGRYERFVERSRDTPLAEDIVARIALALKRSPGTSILVHLADLCRVPILLQSLSLKQLTEIDTGGARVILAGSQWDQQAKHETYSDGIEECWFDSMRALKAVALTMRLVADDTEFRALEAQLKTGQWTERGEGESEGIRALLNGLASDHEGCIADFRFFLDDAPGKVTLGETLSATLKRMLDEPDPAIMTALFLFSRFRVLDTSLFERLHASLAPALAPAGAEKPVSTALTDAVLRACQYRIRPGERGKQRVGLKTPAWGDALARQLARDYPATVRTLERELIARGPAMIAEGPLRAVVIRSIMSRLIDDDLMNSPVAATHLADLLFPPDRKRHSLAGNMAVLHAIISSYEDLRAGRVVEIAADLQVVQLLLLAGRWGSHPHSAEIWGLVWSWAFALQTKPVSQRLAVLLEALQHPLALRAAVDGFFKAAPPQTEAGIAEVLTVLLECLPYDSERQETVDLFKRQIVMHLLPLLLAEQRADGGAEARLPPDMRERLRRMLAGLLAREHIRPIQVEEIDFYGSLNRVSGDIDIARQVASVIRRGVLYGLSFVFSNHSVPLSPDYAVDFAESRMALRKGFELFATTRIFADSPRASVPAGHVARLAALPLLLAVIRLHDADGSSAGHRPDPEVQALFTRGPDGARPDRLVLELAQSYCDDVAWTAANLRIEWLPVEFTRSQARSHLKALFTEIRGCGKLLCSR